jgi:predicted transcriptional regulator
MFLPILRRNSLNAPLWDTLQHMKNRSNTDIVAQILQVANDNTHKITKTRIMYKAFLSYGQLKEYLNLLIENNLLEYQQNSKTFKITQKGIEFIETYKEMEKYMNMSVPDLSSLLTTTTTTTINTPEFSLRHC